MSRNTIGVKLMRALDSKVVSIAAILEIDEDEADAGGPEATEPKTETDGPETDESEIDEPVTDESEIDEPVTDESDIDEPEIEEE